MMRSKIAIGRPPPAPLVACSRIDNDSPSTHSSQEEENAILLSEIEHPGGIAVFDTRRNRCFIEEHAPGSEDRRHSAAGSS